MKLHIPDQSEPNKDSIPSTPRKFKKWLSDLPSSNMGQLTRQTFNALRDLNRQTMPNKHRLENMEMLREPTRNIFDNLSKYFVNRTLPLPEKSQKIVQLNQALLKEMATGYMIIVYEAANKVDKKVDTKTLSTSIYRAIRYQAELLLRASEIYEKYPPGTWVDIHQLYMFAEEENIHNKSITDNENMTNKTSIENVYKQVLLFSLSRPIALRQSDTDRVYYKLSEWAAKTKLGNTPQENQINRFFCARVEEDRPPGYLTQKDCDCEEKIRTLETANLVDIIRKEISNTNQKPGAFAVGDSLSNETLQALSMSWGICSKRRFSRAEKGGHIAAAIGLSHAAKVIRLEETEDDTAAEAVNPMSEDIFTLETIPEELKAMSESSTAYITHTEIGKHDQNAWDLVASGKALTESYNVDREIEGRAQLNKEDDDLHWMVVNVSAGGYCLRWNSDTTSKAQIGEIIAVREREADGGYQWRVGVIRWMQFTRESGLEIGVQILSPKVISARALRSNRPNEAPFDCLMLPGIRPLKQAPTMLLPAHAFKTGDKLKVNVFEHDMEISLNTSKEHTGSFTQFEFTNFDATKKIKREKINKKNDTDKNKDDFDEIWTSL